MRRTERPVVLTVMGILGIVFGGLGLLCGLTGLSMNLFVASMGSKPGAGNPFGGFVAFMDREAPSWKVVEIGHGGVLTLLSALLIVAGIGLLMRKNWGRWLAVFYAVGVIALKIGYTAYELGVVLPAVEKWQRTQMVGATAVGGTTGSAGGVLIATAISIGLATGLLVTMFLPSAAAGCSPGRRRRPDRDEFDDEDADRDWDDRPRRRRREDAEDDEQLDRPARRRADEDDGDRHRFRRKPD